ncbi:MAG: hypothetical protein QF605_08410, partial [Rhodospirillales bacterium]|nr:hypothetical protein [Rhodospirillales bacterium]
TMHTTFSTVDATPITTRPPLFIGRLILGRGGISSMIFRQTPSFFAAPFSIFHSKLYLLGLKRLLL